MNVNLTRTATAEQGHGIIKSTNGEQNQMLASRREERTEHSILIKLEARFSVARCKPRVPYSYQCKPPAKISTELVVGPLWESWKKQQADFSGQDLRAEPVPEVRKTIRGGKHVRYGIYSGRTCQTENWVQFMRASWGSTACWLVVHRAEIRGSPQKLAPWHTQRDVKPSRLIVLDGIDRILDRPEAGPGTLAQ